MADEGIDLVICNPIPVYGNLITGVALASGVLATIGGIVLRDPIVAAVGGAVTVYGVLSILKCYGNSLTQEKPSTTAKELAEKIEETIKPEEVAQVLTGKIVGEAVSAVLT